MATQLTQVTPSVLANTAVTPGNYGASSKVSTFVVDAQGRLTNAANVNILIANTAVTGLSPSSYIDATNASNIVTGTLPSGQIQGAYSGITGVGTITIGTWTANTLQPAQIVGNVSNPTFTTSLIPQLPTSKIIGLATSATTDTTNASNVIIGTLPTSVVPQLPTSKITGLATSATTDTTNASNIITGTLPLTIIPQIPNAKIIGLATSATTDTSNAANISSGTLAVSRLPSIPATLLPASIPAGQIALLNQNTSGSANSINTIGVGGTGSYYTVQQIGTKLVFSFNGTSVFSIDSSGNMIAKGDVTAFGTP